MTHARAPRSASPSAAASPRPRPQSARLIAGPVALAAAALLAACGTPQGESAQPGTAPATAPAAASPSSAACTPITEAEVAALFERWNTDLASGDPEAVVDNYAAESILLPTVSNTPRVDRAEKVDYFANWLPNKPQGVVNERFIVIDCDTAVDAGTYTFTYADGTVVPARYTFTYAPEGGEWLITSHHSSAMPEEAVAPATATAPAPSTVTPTETATATATASN